MNASGIASTVISPRRGWRPRRASSAGGQRPPAAIEPVERSRRSASYSSRGGSDRSRSRQPDAHRVGRDPAERHRLRLAGQDPLDLAEPVRRPSRRRGRGPRAAPSGPRRSRRTRSASGQGAPASTAGRVAASRGRPAWQSVEQRRRPCAPVWHAGRSMGGHDHRSARLDRGRPPPPQQGRPAMTRDHLDAAPPTRPAPGSTRTPTPRRPTSCRSRASTTSSSGSATPARPRPTTAPCGASRRSPSAASRPRSATGPATSWSRTTSGSCSPRR